MKLFALALGALLPALAAVPGLDPGKAMGNPSAPIVVQVFSDYECPSCKMFHDETLPKIIRDYVAAGKVFLVYRDFPLPNHQYSRQAATYACAAARLGLFQPVADALFRNQDSWANSGKVWECVATVLTEKQQKEVLALAATPEIKAEINRDLNLGYVEKINSTPTLIVSHGAQKFPVSGSLNYVLLQKLFEDVAK